MNSLTTLGQKDPVSEYNTMLWNNGTDAGKEAARKQKRKLTYIANIYVVKDPANPENEGKVFLYKFGKKIFDKLTAAMQPEFEDEEAIVSFILSNKTCISVSGGKPISATDLRRFSFISTASGSSERDNLVYMILCFSSKVCNFSTCSLLVSASIPPKVRILP